MFAGSGDAENDFMDVLNRPTGHNEFLPQPEFVDFIKDMRDILNLHKDYLLLKITLFYLSLNRSKKEKDQEFVLKDL